MIIPISGHRMNLYSIGIFIAGVIVFVAQSVIDFMILLALWSLHIVILTMNAQHLATIVNHGSG